MTTDQIISAVREAGACSDAIKWLQSKSGRATEEIIKALLPGWAAWALRNLPAEMTLPWRAELLVVACEDAEYAVRLLQEPGNAAPWAKRERADLVASTCMEPMAAGRLLRDHGASDPLSKRERVKLFAAARRNKKIAYELIYSPGESAPLSIAELNAIREAARD